MTHTPSAPTVIRIVDPSGSAGAEAVRAATDWLSASGRPGAALLLSDALDAKALVDAMGDRTIRTLLGWPQHEPSLPETDPAPDLLVSVAARDTLRLPLALAIVRGLEAQGLLPRRRQADVETSLHEALANAAMHGSSSGAESMSDAASDTPDARGSRVADDPVAGAAPVVVAAFGRADGLTLTVRQAQPIVMPPHTGGAARYSGRGIDLIRAMADTVETGADGHVLALHFRAPEGS